MELMKPEENAKESASSELISQLFGPVVGFSIGDPTGISAAVVSVFTKWSLDRFITPLISNRESIRLLQWGKQAAEGIAQRLANGEKYRTDGFFSKTPTKRSNMDEAVEFTLKTVIETTEEPKIRYMSYLTENVHFDSDLDKDTYRRLLKILEELSYRQLCLVKLFMNADQIDLDSLGNPNITQNLSSILTDCIEIRDKGFIYSRNPLLIRIEKMYLGSSGDYIVDSEKSPEYPGFADPPGFSNILSDDLLKFARLDQIPAEDVDSILRELKNE